MTAVRDFVVPVLTLESAGAEVSMKRFEGTAFLVSHPAGYAVTAAHVTREWVEGQHVLAFVSADQFWVGVDVEVVAVHPSEDVALL